MRLDALTVAGAAQVAAACSAWVLFPVYPARRKGRAGTDLAMEIIRAADPRGLRGKVMKYMQNTALLLDLA